MEFKKYNSLENSYQMKTIEYMVMNGFDKATYVVQEKVHGANFSLITDGVDVKMAKRSGFIELDEDFFNAQNVYLLYRSRMIALFNKVKAENPKLNTLTVFGELYGGNYSHSAVLKNNTAKRVQRGIDYNPNNDFYAFDIRMNGIFLGVDAANKLLEEFDFFYAKTLFRGSLKEALEFPNEFQTKIPTWLGLPEIEGNNCEGVVIRPIEPLYFSSGKRVILKNKNETWTEKAKKKVPKAPIVFSGEMKLLWENMNEFITLNRWNNLLSKEGEFVVKKMGLFIGLYSKDVLNDFLKENEDAWEKLPKEDRKQLTKRLNKEVVNFIKKKCLRLT